MGGGGLPPTPEGTGLNTRRHDTEALREQIRAAALRLFAQQGFSGTTVQQVAEAVGISKQLLLYHFPSKEELRQSVVEQMGRVWGEVLPRVLDIISSDGNRVDTAVEELITFLTLHADIARVALLDLVTEGSPLGARVTSDVRPWMQVGADFLRLRQREGLFDPAADPEAFLIGVGTLLLGTIALLHQGPDAWPPGVDAEAWRRRRLREAVRMVKAGILRR